MSNRIVPATYRNIIDEVIAGIKADFEDAGVEHDVIQELQNRWEMKVVASRVAQFEPAPPSPPHRLPPLPPPPPPGYIKTEPVDHYALYGPAANGYAGPSSIPGRPPQPGVPAHPAYAAVPNGNGAVTANGQQRSHSEESDSDETATHHPTPQKPASKPAKPPKAKPLPTNDEEIGSDLDDSDDEELGEEEEGEEAGRDSVLCTWDKVQRVKNKWKCVLKDGIMHINGKDYLFSKCTGEFDW